MTAVLVAAALSGAVLAASTVLLFRRLAGAPLGRRLVNCLYPLSQLAFIEFNMAALLVAPDARYRVPYALLLAVCAMLCAVVDAALFRSLEEAEREMLYRERSRLLTWQLRAQRRHFDELRRDLRAADRVDAGIADDLARVRGALEAHDADAVCELARSACEALPESRAFCERRAVDALFSVKIPAMQAEGIACSCDLDVDDSCTLTDVELCALFANLLDNAAEACRRLPEGDRWMRIEARRTLGCLFVETRNAAGAPPSLRRPPGGGARRGRRLAAHGWGLSIIRRIAERHDGTFEVERGVSPDGGHWFEARAMLPSMTGR